VEPQHHGVRRLSWEVFRGQLRRAQLHVPLEQVIQTP